jgi:hypothetical protein
MSVARAFVRPRPSASKMVTSPDDATTLPARRAERVRQSEAPSRVSVRSASCTIVSTIDETVGSASITPTT